MKKKLLVTTSIILSLYSITIEAQSVYSETGIDPYISQRNVEVYLEADFTGTPYKEKNFKNGTILKNGAPIAKNIGLRYNASKDLFEVKKSSVRTDDFLTSNKSFDALYLSPIFFAIGAPFFKMVPFLKFFSL